MTTLAFAHIMLGLKGANMDDRLITLPDSDFIKEFLQAKTEKDTSPTQLYVDGHIDLPYFMIKHAPDMTFDEFDKGPFTPELARQSGVRFFATAIYCQDIFNGDSAFRHFQENLNFTVRHMENLLHVKNISDIDSLKEEEDKLGTLFLLENADALAEDNRHIHRLKEENIFIVGMTHAGTNRLADGNAVPHSDGITPEGREVIHILTENNILIDVAHLHPSCFWQLLDLVEKPIISSHTGIRDICDIPRNINLEQVKEIVERGGLVGITFNPEMLSLDKDADIDLIFRHLDTVVQKYGVDFVGIGSDFCGFDVPAHGMEDITGTKDLIKFMSSHGYKREDIDKIMGLNWLRIYEKVF
jgi:membrane dipeptidase